MDLPRLVGIQFTLNANLEMVEFKYLMKSVASFSSSQNEVTILLRLCKACHNVVSSIGSVLDMAFQEYG